VISVYPLIKIQDGGGEIVVVLSSEVLAFLIFELDWIRDIGQAGWVSVSGL
jgi:hypothetical protein